MSKKNYIKEYIRDWLLLQIDRLDTCNSDELEKIFDVINNELNTYISRKEAIKHFDTHENTFDTTIHRRLSSKHIKRNIVTYSFKELFSIFRKK